MQVRVLLAAGMIACAGCAVYSPPVKGFDPEKLAPFGRTTGVVEKVSVPAIFDGNSFICGNKGIRAGANDSQIFSLKLNGALVGPMLLRFQVADNRNAWKVKNQETLADLQKKEIVRTADIPLNQDMESDYKKEAGGKVFYESRVSLLADGRVRVEVEVKGPERQAVTGEYMFVTWPVLSLPAQSVVIEGKLHPLTSSTGRNFYDGVPAQPVQFSPGDPDYSFNLETTNRLIIKESNDADGTKLMGLTLCAENHRIEFVLDFREVSKASLVQAEDAYCGIDFWKNDRLHIPSYDKCRNLLINPSFEADFRYYDQFPLAVSYNPNRQVKVVMAIDEKESRFGQRSLVYDAESFQASYLKPFIQPVEANTPYTVSFYAKAEKTNSSVEVRSLISRGVANELPQKYFAVPCGRWERFTYTVATPQPGLAVMLRCWYNGSDKSGKVWIDGLQLEKGSTATDYTERPVVGRLLTSNPDNFLAPGDPIAARLKLISGQPQTRGTVAVSVADFFYNSVYSNRYDFKTDASGLAEISLPLDGRLGNGLYVVQADYRLADGWTDSDFFRVARMDPLDNRHKHKDIFASEFYWNLPRQDDLMRRIRETGFGSFGFCTDLRLVGDQSFFARLKENRIVYSVHGMNNDAWGLGSRTLNTNYFDVGFFAGLTEVSPDVEKKLEEASYDMAKSLPWVNRWEFDSECGVRYATLKNKKFDEFAKLLVAHYKGVKRANPDAYVQMGGGPYNMDPAQGIAELENIIKGTLAVAPEIRFDGVAIHPYRPKPEAPDLDADTQALLAMLAKYGYEKHVEFTEGIFIGNYTVPEWGLTPYTGNPGINPYYGGAISYDMGWAERISAAFYARSWLVALKYHNNIKQFNGFAAKLLFMDAYLTPFALQKIPNTLGHLLGNAEFKKDIRFAAQTRCYVFEDETRRPVAALWSYIPTVDQGIEVCPTAAVDLEGLEAECSDLMQNRQVFGKDAMGRTLVPVSSYPIFIRCKAGSLNKLCRALSAATLNRSFDLLELAMRPQGMRMAAVTALNPLTVPFTGKLASGDTNIGVTLASGQTQTFEVKLPQPLAPDRVVEQVIPVTVTAAGGQKTEKSFALRCFPALAAIAPIMVDGDLSDWKDYKPIVLPNKVDLTKTPVALPFGGDYRVAWDKKYLYVAVNVIDGKPVGMSGSDPAHGKNSDALQLFIDTQGGSDGSGGDGYDENEYVFDCFPDKDRLVVFRRMAPDIQLRGGVFAPPVMAVEPNIKAAFRRTAQGYVYELAFPLEYLIPMKLEVGVSVGFGVSLRNRNDGEVAEVLNNGVAGKLCEDHPATWPVMLLIQNATAR